MAHLTESDVHAAAYELLRDHSNPGIDAVAKRLGRGSRTTIHKYLKTFWQQLGDRLAAPAAPALPSDVRDLMETLWARAIEQTRAAAESALSARLAAAASLEQRARDALEEARRQSEAASSAIATAHSARDNAEQRATAAIEHARMASQRCAEAERMQQQTTAACERAEQRASHLEHHFSSIESAHAAALDSLRAAHADEIARIESSHVRELDRVRVTLDNERTRAASHAKDAAQREVRLQDALTAARAAQLDAATREARTRTELGVANERIQTAAADIATLRALVDDLERRCAELARRLDDATALAATRADWIAPDHLATSVHRLFADQSSSPLDAATILAAVIEPYPIPAPTRDDEGA